MKLADKQQTLYRIGQALSRLHAINDWGAPKSQHYEKPILALTNAIKEAKGRGIPAVLERELADILSSVTEYDMVVEIIPPSKQLPLIHGSCGYPGGMFVDKAE